MLGTGTSRGRSLPSVPCRSLPSDVTWRCTCGCRIEPSMVWMCEISCAPCSGTCEDPWCFSGTKGPSTGAKRSACSFGSIPGSIPNTSRPMPRNSIRLSTCGTRPIATWPTGLQPMWRSCAVRSSPPSGGFTPPSGCCGLASMLRICRGLNERRFLYLCKPQ